MKLLITGGAGFIGSNFIRYMVQAYPHYRMTNLDALTYAGHLDNVKDVQDHQHYHFVHGSITDRQLVEQIMSQGIDVVINFAAESHVDRSIRRPSVFVETNVLGVQVLLDAATKYGVKKFVQISTDEVYGELGDEGVFTEDTALSPNSPYSASKASADLLVRAYGETFGLPFNITRCSNNYGPYQFPEKLIPNMIQHALRDELLPVYGTGMNVRDWLHVEDHCRAIDLVIHKGEDQKIYNIGGNNERTNLHIVQTILKELNKPESQFHFVDDRLGHDWRYAIDASLIKQELGWEPKYSCETGLKETIRWYLDHQDWCESVLKKAKEV